MLKLVPRKLYWQFRFFDCVPDVSNVMFLSLMDPIVVWTAVGGFACAVSVMFFFVSDGNFIYCEKDFPVKGLAVVWRNL